MCKRRLLNLVTTETLVATANRDRVNSVELATLFEAMDGSNAVNLVHNRCRSADALATATGIACLATQTIRAITMHCALAKHVSPDNRAWSIGCASDMTISAKVSINSLLAADQH